MDSLRNDAPILLHIKLDWWHKNNFMNISINKVHIELKKECKGEVVV